MKPYKEIQQYQRRLASRWAISAAGEAQLRREQVGPLDHQLEVTGSLNLLVEAVEEADDFVVVRRGEVPVLPGRNPAIGHSAATRQPCEM